MRFLIYLMVYSYDITALTSMRKCIMPKLYIIIYKSKGTGFVYPMP